MKFAHAPAALPGPLPQWDPQWSRLVTVDTVDGEHTFHVLDTLPALRAAGREPTGTILALHGNPTWSYLWRHLAAATVDAATAVEGGRVWRVIAPDQLEMGYSERLAHDGLPTTHGTGYRRIAERVTDFDAVVTRLLAEAPSGSAGAAPAGAPGAAAEAPAGHPVVTLGHDWGGVLSLTWAARHLDVVDAVISLNTAVQHTGDESLPAPLQAALAGPVLPTSTVLTDLFLRITLGLGQGPIPKEIKDAFSSPYQDAAARRGIGAFVADIPAQETHPSYAELQQLGEDIAGIDVPALLIWGPKDPVFVERYLRDLRTRLPHADIHRFEQASHLVSEDADVSGVVLRWVEERFPGQGSPAAGAAARQPADVTAGAADEPAGASASMTSEAASTADGPASDQAQMIYDALDERAGSRAVASVDMSQRPPQSITWTQLSSVVDGIARGLQQLGLQKGDRVSLLVSPGNNLTAALYAVLKAGGVAVVADAGLGPAGMTRAVKAADPQWIIGQRPGLTLARGAGWPGRRISVTPVDALGRVAFGVETSLTELSRTSATEPIRTPEPDDDAAILFTSGSTGPAKGVVYTHARLGELAAVLQWYFKVRPGTGLVAGFAPFALLGPGIGATSVTPDMSVTKPRTLTAAALADAIIAADCTMVFASPAAYTNVCATASELSEEQRAACANIELVLSAGAPVPLPLMDALAEIFPEAAIHSPYGMTEGLLLTDIDRQGVAAAEAQTRHQGVCVGTPIPRVRFAVAPLDDAGRSGRELLTGEDAVDVLGEFVVSAPHIKAGYDRLWYTDAASKRDELAGLSWHRTNDIGHIDQEGRVWLEGRLQHVLTTAEGPLGPGGVEAVVDRVPGVFRSALVGVGPEGAQVAVVVIEPDAEAPAGSRQKPGLATLELADEVRAAVAEHYSTDIAAVLSSPPFPTDIRHNSKIDRARLAVWADAVLRGEPVGKP
ncbi:alpha/beta fold hydrolase [Brevibacterium daeguense]|uniref:Alpha/beta fold hydrolase n=1 Tax=Brevibacterium daeguense TaxID=909936 RepID=A0ABP8EHV5_9MICO